MSTEHDVPIPSSRSGSTAPDRVRLVVGVGGLALAAGGVGDLAGAFFPAYLVGFLFWLGIAWAAIGLTMLHHLVGGSWGLVIRRPLESGAHERAAAGPLFLPIAFGMSVALSVGARRVEPGTRRLVEHSRVPERVVFLGPRRGLLRDLDRDGACLERAVEPAGSHERPGTEPSAPGACAGRATVLLFLAGTFSAIDWGMSLDAHWTSTIYRRDGHHRRRAGDVGADDRRGRSPGRRTGRCREIATPGRLNDLGNLLLAFVMLWAYMSFCQFLIIWSGNLTEEIPWYLRRTRGGWQWVALALIVFHFSCRSSCSCSARTSERRARCRAWLSGFLSCTGSTWSGW